MAGGYDVERKRKERKTLGKNGTVKEASYIAELQRRLVEFAFHVPSSWIPHGWSGKKAARKSIPESWPTRAPLYSAHRSQKSRT